MRMAAARPHSTPAAFPRGEGGGLPFRATSFEFFTSLPEVKTTIARVGLKARRLVLCGYSGQGWA